MISTVHKLDETTALKSGEFQDLWDERKFNSILVAGWMPECIS